MTITKEISLSNFDFWSGAKRTVEWLTTEDLDYIEEQLTEIWDGLIITETVINDFFWFEDDAVARMLGYDNFDDLMANRKAESEC